MRSAATDKYGHLPATWRAKEAQKYICARKERYYLHMTKTIVAVYKVGVFKPLQKIDIPEHKHVHLVVIPEGDADLLESQRKELSSIIGIGESGISDVSRRHDHYLYEG
jgi:predicted DNA-binding antitoxin AbrB/MazE fold protein